MASHAKPYDYLFKLLLIGNSGVGKTSLLLRYCDQAFNTSHMATIGVDFKIRTIELDGKKIKLQLWDTAGQERFKTLTTEFYRRAMGIMLVYNITDRNSFDRMRNWIRDVEDFASPGIERMLIGNKCDMEVRRQVDRKEGENLATEYGIKFFETSAQEDINVEEAFLTLAKDIKTKLYNSPSAKKSEAEPDDSVITSKSDPNKKPNTSSGSCC